MWVVLFFCRCLVLSLALARAFVRRLAAKKQKQGRWPAGRDQRRPTPHPSQSLGAAAAENSVAAKQTRRGRSQINELAAFALPISEAEEQRAENGTESDAEEYPFLNRKNTDVEKK